MSLKSPRVCLVYDRVNTPYGGAEKVLLSLHQAFPKAPLFTSLYNPKQANWAKSFPVIKTSFLQPLSFIPGIHRWLAWLMPLAFESLDLSRFDIIISVTSAEAKGVLTLPHQLHICYLLTPPRYLYQSREHSLDAHWLLRLPLLRQFAQAWLSYLKWWDQAAIFRPDAIIPIARRVAKRVSLFYQAVRLEPVIYPPVELKLNRVKPIGLSKTIAQPYFLIISRLVSHKHLDLAIRACGKLNQNLVIVGEGPELNKLKQLVGKLQASTQVTFLSNINDQQLASLYTHCQAVLMPGEEDFGIVAMEANSFGKPVLINQYSGAAELIKPGLHGLHIARASLAALEKALHQFSQSQFSARQLGQNPVKYGTTTFIQTFKKRVNALWKEHKQTYD